MNDNTRTIELLKKRQSEHFVMATIIHVEGSAYRHMGAKLLIDGQGEIYGTISGGCLEEDLIHHAQNVFQTRRSEIMTYDLRSDDDLGWGISAGCNGTVTIFLEDVDWPHWQIIDETLLRGINVYILKLLDDNQHLKNVLYYSEKGELLYSTSPDDFLLQKIKEFMNLEDKILFEEVNGNEKLILESFQPKEKLYIFGAGRDAEPVVSLLSQLDFNVYVIDPREERTKKEYFPNATQITTEFPHIFLENHEIPISCFVLIMTHHFNWDQMLVERLMANSPQYIGILGPRNRTERLLSSNTIPENIYSPIGLSIHAEGPEEIAVSIAAEIVKVRNLNKKSSKNRLTKNI